jgi:hypothetical protein
MELFPEATFNLDIILVQEYIFLLLYILFWHNYMRSTEIKAGKFRDFLQDCQLF